MTKKDDTNHLIWEVADGKWVKTRHDKPYPLFDLEDISWLFGYEFETVLTTFNHLSEDDEHLNSTFLTDDEGVYCTILIPMLLCRVSVMDGMTLPEESLDYVGGCGHVVEQTMPDADIYLTLMTGIADHFIQKAFNKGK